MMILYVCRHTGRGRLTETAKEKEEEEAAAAVDANARSGVGDPGSEIEATDLKTLYPDLRRFLYNEKKLKILI